MKIPKCTKVVKYSEQNIIEIFSNEKYKRELDPISKEM